MAESKCSWVKKDNGTVEDSDNDLMWVLRDSRQELWKWLNWDEGHAYVKACNEQNYLLSVNQINLYNFLQQDSDGIEK